MNKPLQIRIDAQIKRRLKAALATRGITINDFALEALQLGCDKYKMSIKITGGKL